MIRKSVETRDWMNTIEPRNVRAVMKRIVEDVTAIDTQVSQLYEEGVRKAHSSGVDRTVLFPCTNPSIAWAVLFRSLKTESIRKLSNFNFQWTKTLCQNNLNNIAFFFTFFKGYRCN